ncbi:hypothetical protein ACFWTE_16860 [Nocardiopsis sp. NPDC058631]|uniref:hypothetical protein n=1 Tax=Nocardiopsis sp. NPDC058631 TaxID=3346566 RepID=UPI003655BFF5
MSRAQDRRSTGSLWWVAVAAAPLVGLAWWGVARALAVRRAGADGTSEALDRGRAGAARAHAHEGRRRCGDRGTRPE